MDKSTEYNPYAFYGNMNPESSPSDMYQDPMFNPMMQYEQSYLYYRSLCMQLDYKIKCKEYENLCARTDKRNEQQRI